MPHATSIDDNDTHRRTLMIVEDNFAVREVLCHIASSNGFTPKSYSSASLALGSLTSVRPDAVLLDWDLGEEKSGVDVARAAAGCSWHPAIFMITGSCIEQLRKETRHLPVAAFLQKPFSKASVDRLLREL